MKVEEMVRGRYYSVVFKQQAGNYRWYTKRFSGQFLYIEKNEFEHLAYFSLRPKAGTSDMRVENIVSVVPAANGQVLLPESYKIAAS